MKVKCIGNVGESNLTIGKTYEVIHIFQDSGYMINDDKFEKNLFSKFMFKPLSEYRNDTINKLLEDES